MKKFFNKAVRTMLTISPSRFFIITAFTFGTLFILITPPFQTPDETVHFYRSYQVSEGNLVTDTVNGRTGGVLPSALGETVLMATVPSIEFHPANKYNIHKNKTALSIKVEENKERFYDFSSTALYPPIAYIPQAVGIALSKIVDSPPIISMYFARFANLLIWIAAFALAIRMTPKKKWAFAAVGLLPMALFQGGSLSADVMATGLGAIFVAAILRLSSPNSKGVMKRKHFALFLLAVIAMVLTKQVMFILLPLILLIPLSKLSANIKKAKAMKVSLIVAPLLFFAGWMTSIKDLNISSTFVNGQAPSEQLRFIIENPHSFINVLWNTSFFSWGDMATSSLIGVFGWMDAPLGEIIIIAGYLALFLIFVGSYGKKDFWLTRNQKILFGLVALAFWGAVNTALYLYYSPQEYKIIIGLQGRYFIPLLILLIPLVYGSWLRMSERIYRRIAIIMPIGLLVASVITIYFRYYINNV